jgi:hypothetical protein
MIRVPVYGIIGVAALFFWSAHTRNDQWIVDLENALRCLKFGRLPGCDFRKGPGEVR